MISSQELNRSLSGTIRLAKADPAGIGYFNASLDGFWNSLTAAFIILPGHAFVTWLSYLAVPAEASTGRIFLVEGIAFAVQWTAFQLALFHYCRYVGRADRFFHAAVALNWIDVPIMTVRVGLALLLLAGLPGGFGDLLQFALTILVIIYVGFVAKIGLRSSIPVAIGPIVIGIVLSFIIHSIATGMTGQG